MIPPPHGGRLIDRRVGYRVAERRIEEAELLPRLHVELEQILDADKIGVGAYSPLEGFMSRASLESVCRDSRLPNSVPWTVPVVLTPPGRRNRSVIDGVRPGDEIALLDSRGRLIAVLHLEERFAFDKPFVAQRVYGTTSTAHPNVADLLATGEIALSGPIDLVARAESIAPDRELTPLEMRRAFAQRQWSNVAAYQTRNVPHRAHEHLERLTLEREEIDGLLIHPVIGRLKPGDYLPEVVVRAHDLLIQHYLPPERVLLATLSIGMRYAGPRAALFLAIVRKNFGCSHYVLGRDQAGAGGFYDPYASQRIFDELPVGVIPLRYAESWYCRKCEGTGSPRSCPHPDSFREPISQRRIRSALRDHEPLPPNLLRPEVLSMLRGTARLFNDVPPGPVLTEAIQLVAGAPRPSGLAPLSGRS
ncbi:MAG: sulfate adenylyltransferase [Thermoplasmata archaeon]|nr:sulfate adenylyltransferase [Thermoplasmata archaeon]